MTAAVCIAGDAMGTAAVHAQQAETRSFEVTSVKPNRTGDRSSRFQLLPGGRFVATNTTVRALLQAAYRFDYQPFQIVGGPSWLDSERFDVEGRAGTSSPTPAEVDVMVRSLLVTRFKMSFTKETRDMPVYHLMRARADGRAGPQFRPASKPCDRSPVGVNVPAPADALPRCGLALFTAMQEQLGLRLEPARGPVVVLVIQSAERPEEN